MDREELKQRLRALNDPWKCAAFAARMALLALPGLAVRADEDSQEKSSGLATGKGQKPFLWYWKVEEREKYLLAVLRTGQLAWSAALLQDREMSAASDAAAADADAAAYAAYAAYAAAYAAVYAAAYAAADAANADYAADAAAAYAADAADAADADLWKKAIENIYFLYKNHSVKSFLSQSSDFIHPHLSSRFIQGLQDLGQGFDSYWLPWYQDRMAGKPLDLSTLKAQIMLSEEEQHLSPAEINARLLERASNASKNVSHSLLSPQTTLNRVRVIFLGYGETGKTSLVRTLFNEPVIESQEAMTPGIDIREWEVPGTDIKAHFWDFGGQVMAHATHQFFLRSRCLYVLLLNARTDINANQQAEYWLEHVKAFGGDSKVLLVGNKSDLTQVNLDLLRLKEAYPDEQQAGQSRIVDFYPLSCTSYQDGGQFQRYFDIFKADLIQHLQAMEIHQTRFSPAEFQVLKDLREQSPRSAFLSKADYAALCEAQGIRATGGFNHDSLLTLLDALGVVLHFPRITRLDDYVLNPRWLTYGVYTLLYAQQARLAETAARDILTAKTVEDHEGNKLTYPPDRYWVILEAMKEFELCYELPHERGHYVIPDLLPSDQPADLYFERTRALRFDFDFEGFLPRHLSANFIVRRHEEIVDEVVWQNGVRLRSAQWQADALAMADYHGRRWSLWLSGHDAARYFDELYAEVKKILGRMDLVYGEWVWLPGTGNKANAQGAIAKVHHL